VGRVFQAGIDGLERPLKQQPPLAFLGELKADIGQRVKEGEVLAVLNIPEVAKPRQAKQADIGRLEAEGRRAAADLSVATARVAVYAAKVEGSTAVKVEFFKKSRQMIQLEYSL
jgi:hypothetical protein